MSIETATIGTSQEWREDDDGWPIAFSGRGTLRIEAEGDWGDIVALKERLRTIVLHQHHAEGEKGR